MDLSSLEVLSDPDRCLFVDPPPPYLHLKCPICLETLLPEPYLVSCCGHHFCENCVKKLRKNPCPLCKAPDSTHSRVPDKGQQRALNSIRVYCPNKKKSCEWAGEFGMLRNHLLESCAFVPITCKFKCGAQVDRKDLELHESEKCPRRPATCRHCTTYSSSYDMTLVHELKCPKAEIICPHGCGASPFLRETQSQHMQSCPVVPISCTFAYAGCKWLGPKEAHDKHCDEVWKKHVSLVTSHTAQVAIQKQDEKISVLSEKLDKQETIIREQTKDIEALKQMHSELLRTISSEVSSSNVKPLQLPPVPDGKKTLKLVIDRYSHKKMNNNLHHSSVFKFGDDSACSMQLTVYLNGKEEGKGSHISVYIGFPRSLPFHGSWLLIRLRSQNQLYGHYDKVVTFDDNAIETVMLPSGLAKQLGMPTFIQHSSVMPAYLRNDSLLFELPQIIV